jgi:ATP/maltotriose-dependent transcriptional regulator MalT
MLDLLSALVEKSLVVTEAGAERALRYGMHTVHRHVSNVLGKLGVSSRAAAVAQAAQLGLL